MEVVESRTLPAGWMDISYAIRPQRIFQKISYKVFSLTPRSLTEETPSKCVECDHLLVGVEVEYLYKGKSYCDDCYRAIKKTVTGD